MWDNMSRNMNMDFFVHNVKKSLEHCKLRKLDRFLDSDEWQAFNKIDFTKDDRNTKTFVITKKGSYYCFKCLEYLQNINQKQQKNFSEEFLNRLFFDFLEELKRKNHPLTDFCKDFIKKIEEIQELNYKFLIPISRSQYWKNLNFGKLKIVSITDNILKEEFGLVDHFMENSKDLIKTNETDIFGIVNVSSVDQTTAKEIAYEIVERYISSRRLLDPSTFMRLRKNDLHQINESILIKHGKSVTSSGENHDIPIRITPSHSFYENLKPYEEKLNNFLFNPTTDLERMILDALYWFGEVDHYKDNNIRKFLSGINGIETILLTGFKDRKKFKKFGENVSLFLNKEDTHSAFYEKSYLKRSTITHETVESISNQEVLNQMSYLRQILLTLIELSDKYSDLNDLLKKEFNIINIQTQDSKGKKSFLKKLKDFFYSFLKRDVNNT